MTLANSLGLTRTRDRLRLFVGFVQATQYVVSREGGLADSIERFGVQMPVETLVSHQGDCDSCSLLLLTLLRAAGFVQAGLMLVESADSGHAMVVVRMEPVAGDYVVSAKDARFIPVECTGEFPIGYCDAVYIGRSVRAVALG